MSFAAFLVLLTLATPGSRDPLTLLSANIVELATELDPLERTVLLWIEVQSAPECPASGGTVEYGFLIDADRDRSTGITDPGLDVGIDARITAHCQSGRWSSPAGEATVTGGNPARVEIRTTVARLPSQSFRWIAYASRGVQVVGLPAPSPQGSGVAGHSAWAVLERAQP